MGYLDFYKLPDEEKQDIFNSVEYATGLPPFAVEKDWWVVRTLEIIFETGIAPHLVFKGGTSLSKAWDLIDRFSEDLDLALDKSFLGFSEELTRKKEVNKLRRASYKYVSESFYPQLQEGFKSKGFEGIEINLGEVTSTDQDPLILEIYYPALTKQSDYVQPSVLVEIGSRSLREPFSEKSIQSDIGREFSDQSFVDVPITIPTVNPERTYLEKLFLLHEEFQRPQEKIRVNRLSRHLYDIYQIAQTEYAQRAIQDLGLYRSIVKHRSVYTRFGRVDYESHFPPNLNPIPPEEMLSEWEQDYRIMQAQMIYGESLPFNKLVDEISKITDSINQLKFK